MVEESDATECVTAIQVFTTVYRDTTRLDMSAFDENCLNLNSMKTEKYDYGTMDCGKLSEVLKTLEQLMLNITLSKSFSGAIQYTKTLDQLYSEALQYRNELIPRGLLLMESEPVFQEIEEDRQEIKTRIRDYANAVDNEQTFVFDIFQQINEDMKEIYSGMMLSVYPKLDISSQYLNHNVTKKELSEKMADAEWTLDFNRLLNNLANVIDVIRDFSRHIVRYRGFVRNLYKDIFQQKVEVLDETNIFGLAIVNATSFINDSKLLVSAFPCIKLFLMLTP